MRLRAGEKPAGVGLRLGGVESHEIPAMRRVQHASVRHE